MNETIRSNFLRQAEQHESNAARYAAEAAALGAAYSNERAEILQDAEIELRNAEACRRIAAWR